MHFVIYCGLYLVSLFQVAHFPVWTGYMSVNKTWWIPEEQECFCKGKAQHFCVFSYNAKPTHAHNDWWWQICPIMARKWNDCESALQCTVHWKYLAFLVARKWNDYLKVPFSELFIVNTWLFQNGKESVWTAAPRNTMSATKNNQNYCSTIAPFYHIWSRERAKTDVVLHCRTEQIRSESAEQQNGRTKNKRKRLTLFYFLSHDLSTKTSSLTGQRETSKDIWMVSSFVRALWDRYDSPTILTMQRAF